MQTIERLQFGPYRIDHILLRPAAAARMVDAGVDRERRGREWPSDHAAVWVTLAD